MATNKQRAHAVAKAVFRKDSAFPAGGVLRPGWVDRIEEELNAVEEFAHTADVPARLAQRLLDLSADSSTPTLCAHRSEGRQPTYDVRAPQVELAAAVYTSRSYVSTLIGGWVSLGHIAVVGRILCIRNVKALREIAAARKRVAPEAGATGKAS